MTVVSQYGKVLAAHEGLDIEVGRFKKKTWFASSGKKG